MLWRRLLYKAPFGGRVLAVGSYTLVCTFWPLPQYDETLWKIMATGILAYEYLIDVIQQTYFEII
jgi:hypothetical protein